ncbi:MAG: secretin N-terminal domain-containing protein [Elusimicrobiota bacterium]
MKIITGAMLATIFLVIQLYAVDDIIPTQQQGQSAEAVPELRSEDKSISLNFQNTDLDVVLKFFSEVTGLIFIKADSVKGNVTVISPVRVSAREALDILQSILEVKGFTMLRKSDRVMKIVSQSEAIQKNVEVNEGSPKNSVSGEDRIITQIIPLKFVGASEIKGDIQSLIFRGGSVLANERTNTLVVTDVASNIQRVLKIIENLDQRTPQVLIEAMITEVTLTEETKLGVEWSFNGQTTIEGEQYTQAISQALGIGGYITEGFKYSIIKDDSKYTGLLQALATDKNVNILSTPHVMASNNKKAVIRVGEEVPVLKDTRILTGGEQVKSYEYKSVAIELEVTPRINPEGEIYLQVHPVIKKILGTNAELNAPILATREIDTSIVVKNGQTIILGGLMRNDESKTLSKVPLLGDIPIIGALFRKSGTVDEKTELLIFITPHIITTSEQAVELTKEKEAQTHIKNTPNREEAIKAYAAGKLLFKQKKYEEAIVEYRRALTYSGDKKMTKKINKGISKAQDRLDGKKPSFFEYIWPF